MGVRQLIEKLEKRIVEGDVAPVYLVTGDLVLAEPAARRLADALALKAGCQVEVRRHPPSLGALLDDLRTYSLFESGKVLIALDTAALADRAAAAELIDEADRALPLDGDGLPARARAGASQLLQALRLFELDPGTAEPPALIDQLPDWVLKGGKKLRRSKPRGRTKKAVEELKDGLAALLTAAIDSGLSGYADGEIAALGDAIREGLPAGHSLVLAERSAAKDHPVVQLLEEKGTHFRAGTVQSEKKGGWQGLGALAQELETQTGAGIERGALEELARRTLRQEDKRRQGPANAESTARLAGEYRKLASLAGQGQITRQMVEETVRDSGDEDVWAILDAIGTGRCNEALERLHRHLSVATDPVGTRLMFFGLLAAFCRQLTAISGLLRVTGTPPGEKSYRRFKSSLVPKLQADLPTAGKSPVASLHPYRLHRAYLAASRMPENELVLLPERVLNTELLLKGGSSDPEAPLINLVTHLATAMD